jgi:hypothetical protein
MVNSTLWCDADAVLIKDPVIPVGKDVQAWIVKNGRL